MGNNANEGRIIMSIKKEVSPKKYYSEEEIGKELVEVLKLRIKKNGFISTTWGEKNPVGITRVIETILKQKAPC